MSHEALQITSFSNLKSKNELFFLIDRWRVEGNMAEEAQKDKSEGRAEKGSGARTTAKSTSTR